MPNWCSNSITISGSTDTIKQLWDDAHVGDDFGLLNAMVPMPKELDDTTKGTDGDAVNWYDWRVQNWGTKWDVSDEGLEYVDNGDGTSTIEGWFQSAWSPPVGAMHKLSQDWDSCYIQLMYEESGMCFVGCWDSEGADDHYEYSDFTSKNIRDNIPNYLVDAFGLDEQLAEYEEEEEETADA